MTVASPPPPPGPPPMAAAPSASSQAITSLILGILSFVCCHILGPVAWILGSQELKAIRMGTSPAAGESVAKAGMILGIIGTIILALGIIWVFFMGGMVILRGLMDR